LSFGSSQNTFHTVHIQHPTDPVPAIHIGGAMLDPEVWAAATHED
jgi:hypothetical protein